MGNSTWCPSCGGNLKELTALDFKWSHGINDQAVELVAKKLPEVIYLDVKDCPFVTSDGIKHVTKHLPKLKHLSFGGGDHMHFANSLQDIEALFLDIARLTELRVLAFDFCDCISDSAIQTLIKTLPNLRVLDVGYVETISDDTADLIGSHLQNLESLSLSSQKLADRGVTTIASKLKQLKSLTYETVK